jgi:hypothetical protein
LSPCGHAVALPRRSPKISVEKRLPSLHARQCQSNREYPKAAALRAPLNGARGPMKKAVFALFQ